MSNSHRIEEVDEAIKRSEYVRNEAQYIMDVASERISKAVLRYVLQYVFHREETTRICQASEK